MTTFTPRVRIGEVVVLTRYIDWRAICEDINRALGQQPNGRARIAELLNISPTTVQTWLEAPAEGKQLRDISYAAGEALLELHRRVCGEEATLGRLREFRERATRTPT